MRRRWIEATALLATVTASGISAAPARGPSESVRTFFAHSNAERLKTIPISRRKNQKPRSVMSVELGNLHDGDRLDGTAEVEVSVCLKPAPHTHDPSGRCVGKMYGYDPRVQGRIVLADDASDAGLKATKGFDNPHALTCRQKQPNRNHHCVLVIDDGVLDTQNANKLPCAPAKCRANLVLTAYDRQARKGHKLVIGSDTPSGGVNQDKGRLDVVRFHPGSIPKDKPKIETKPNRRKLPIAGEGRTPVQKVIYSVALDDLTAGETLTMEAKVVAKIGQHRYNTFMPSSVILSKKGPNSTNRSGLFNVIGIVGAAEIGKLNGFNCTQGRSAHPDPCTARKVGTLEVAGSTNQTVYVNVIAGMNAQLFGDRHRPGDSAKILDRGYLKVRRYAD